MTVSGVPKRQFQARLVAFCAGCTAQHTGWPCGTCATLTGRQWRAVLAYRGDYENCRTPGGYRMAVDIVFHPDGTFSHHVFEEYPLAVLRAEIRALWNRMQTQ